MATWVVGGIYHLGHVPSYDSGVLGGYSVSAFVVFPGLLHVHLCGEEGGSETPRVFTSVPPLPSTPYMDASSRAQDVNMHSVDGLASYQWHRTIPGERTLMSIKVDTKLDYHEDWCRDGRPLYGRGVVADFGGEQRLNS
jgi:hypothetical protein